MNFFRKKDSELGQASTDFYNQINADHVALNLSTEQVALYNVVNTAWNNLYAIAINPETRTQQAIANKDEARTNLVRAAKGLAQLFTVNQT